MGVLRVIGVTMRVMGVIDMVTLITLVYFSSITPITLAETPIRTPT